MDRERPARRRVYDSLNAADKATVDKVCRIGCHLASVAIAGCILAVSYVAAHVWHWPFWLDYTLGPVLGGAIALLAIFAPFWALDRWASHGRKKKPPEAGPEPPSA